MSYIPHNKIIVDEEKVIQEYQNGMSTIELAKKYGYKTPKSINDLLRRNNVLPRTVLEAQQRRKGYNGLSLNRIDSKLKAYYIGLLITDGYIHTDNNKFYIELTLEDLDVIKFLTESFNTKYIIIDKKKENLKILYRVVLHGKELIDDIARYGLAQNKSFTVCKGMKLEYSERKYIPYILRGAIDGDGWIRKDGKEFFLCGASIYFIVWAFNAFVSLGFKNLEISIKPQKNDYGDYHEVYEIRSGIQSNIELLKKYIYDVPYGMNRKYNRLHQNSHEGRSETIIRSLFEGIV